MQPNFDSFRSVLVNGSDWSDLVMSSVPTSASSEQECAARCARDPECTAWQFYPVIYLCEASTAVNVWLANPHADKLVYLMVDDEGRPSPPVPLPIDGEGFGLQGGVQSRILAQNPTKCTFYCIFMPLSSQNLRASTFWDLFRGR